MSKLVNLPSRLKRFYYRLLYHSGLIGAGSLIWFLLRTGVKPSRAVYPCQRTALASSLGFLGSLSASLASWPFFGWLKKGRKVREIILPGFLLTLLFLALMGLKIHQQSQIRLESLHQPLGISQAQAASANRVVRVHNIRATDWDFNGCCYWQHINYQAVREVLERGVIALTDQPDAISAWREIIPDYRQGDGIAIKANNVNFHEDNEGLPNTSPEILKAVMAGLKNIGVPESDITIYDVTDFQVIFPRQRDTVRSAYPGVNFVSQENVVWDDERVNIESLGISRRLPTLLTQSRYLININLMKGHWLASITGAMKNHFGSSQGNIEALHPSLAAGAQLAELNNNPHIRDKTRLIITEAFFMSPRDMNQTPQRLNYLDLFPEGTPNSLFLSTNPVAIDSVLFDYIQAENNYNGDSMVSHQWLHIAAEDFGLGVHEHGTLSPGLYSNKDFTYGVLDYVNFDLNGVQPTLTPTPTPSRCLPLGDIDCSGKVNGLDFGYLLVRWGTADPQANLDDLGVVNALDGLILLSNYGKNP